jgi:hypothetical protein
VRLFLNPLYLVVALILGALTPILFGFHRWMLPARRERTDFVLRKVRGSFDAVRKWSMSPLRHSASMFGSIAVAAAGVLLMLGLVGAGLALALHGPPIAHASAAKLTLAAAPIVELRQALANVIKEANAALEAVTKKAKAESRALTEDELKAQTEWDAKIEAAKQAVDLEQKKLDRERMTAGAGASDVAPGNARTTRVENMQLRAEADPRRGFATHREFLLATIENSGLRDRAAVSDERLRVLAVADKDDKTAAGELAFVLPQAFHPRSLLAAAGSDEQGGYADQYGGALTPRGFLPTLLQVGTEEDPTSGRTQDVPMTTPIVDIPARTDKNHTTSVSGGFTFTRKPEAVAGTCSVSPSRPRKSSRTRRSRSPH